MKKGLLTLLSGIFLAILCFILGPLLFFVPIFLAPHYQQQFTAPGVVTYELQDPGQYIINYNFIDIVEGKAIKQEHYLPDGSQIEVKDSSGVEIPFSGEYQFNQQQDRPTTSARLGYFEIDAPETVTIEVSGFDEPRSLVLEKTATFAWLAFALLGGGILWTIGIIAAIWIIILGIIRLNRPTAPIGSQ